ncbi:hypothetical protein J437_LFUL009778 [Ladona fulva]|uniref:Actin maturation protease n=1 Tax=Ladona fulva TaxID=123851 RepID=A0A8K0K5P0_LADFU|nr:hypothetical protein J437_LFUL009778 [Ladona fulva]
MSIPPPPRIFPVFKDNYGQNLKGCVPNSTKNQTLEDDLKDFFEKILKRMISSKSCFVFNYRYLRPVLQDGPTCGLAALSMASSCRDRMVYVNRILKYTKLRGYSNNGEMFSVEYLADIAKTLIGFEIEVLEKGLENQEYVLNQIMNGALLLIPYDADFNHTPCKKNGHRAHWAVICGLLLEGHLNGQLSAESCQSNSKFNCVQYLPDKDTFVPQNLLNICEVNQVYLLARQGKSVHPGVWSYKELKDSNENLIEFDPIRAESNISYILPPEGVEGGLKGKAVLIKGLKQVTVDEILSYADILKSFL